MAAYLTGCLFMINRPKVPKSRKRHIAAYGKIEQFSVIGWRKRLRERNTSVGGSRVTRQEALGPLPSLKTAAAPCCEQEAAIHSVDQLLGRRRHFMRVRPSRGKVNVQRELVPACSQAASPAARPPDGPGPLLTLRSAVILGAGFLAGLATGTLTWLATDSLAAALLALGPACAGSVTLLNAIIG
jgi:hypothetical protein